MSPPKKQYRKNKVIEVDPTDPKTWIEPVDETREELLGAQRYQATYSIPLCPNSLVVAIFQLPADVPKTNPALIKTFLTKSSIMFEGRQVSGFMVEVVWPLD